MERTPSVEERLRLASQNAALVNRYHYALAAALEDEQDLSQHYALESAAARTINRLTEDIYSQIVAVNAAPTSDSLNTDAPDALTERA